MKYSPDLPINFFSNPNPSSSTDASAQVISYIIINYLYIEIIIMNCIGSEENIEENFQNLKHLFEESKIGNFKHDIRLFFTPTFKSC